MNAKLLFFFSIVLHFWPQIDFLLKKEHIGLSKDSLSAIIIILHHFATLIVLIWSDPTLVFSTCV